MAKLIKITITTLALFFISSIIFTIKVNAASVTLSGSNSTTVGSNISFTVNANSTTEYYGVKATITFSNLTYLSGSPNSIWTSPDGIVRNGNTITFQGASLGSANTGTKRIMTINFRAPSSAGTATISVTGDVKDGSGNSLSTSGNSVSIKVNPPPAQPAGSVTVSSTTHPDQNTWYVSPEVVLNWNKEVGITDLSYILDTISNTTPDDTSEGLATTKTYTLEAGKSYFHIKSKNSIGWGPTTHFQILVDNVIPDPFTVTLVDDSLGKKKLFYATNDSHSGIDKYIVIVNDVELGVLQTGLIIETPSKIVVKAFDKAGNMQQSEFISDVISSTSSKSEEKNKYAIDQSILPLIIGVPFCLLTLIVIFIIGIIIYRKSKRIKSD